MVTRHVGDGVQVAVDNELRLLDPAVRRSPTAVDGLLHPEFTEFGASGRRWDQESMTAEIGEADMTPHEAPVASEVRGVRLADGIVQVTYVTESQGRRARRSSLWLRSDDGAWRLYFHQGTPVPQW